MNKGASSVMLRILPLLLPILLGVVVPVYSALPPALSPTLMAAMSSDCPELLVNGDFEAGSLAPWSSAGAVGLDWGRNGTHGAWLGRGDDVFGELRQAVTIPAGANPVRLEYWWIAESQNDQHLDVLTILIEEADQAQELRVWRAVAPFGQWQQDVLDLTAYAGRSISVVFMVRTDTSVPSEFAVDDVSLKACGGAVSTATATNTQTPMPTATAEHTATPTSTPTSTPGESLVLVVNTTADTDDGTCDATHCSLREAINIADAHNGPSTITFNIPAGDPGRDANGVCTIRPTTDGYYLTNGPMTIDGYTQPGASPNTAPVGQPINAGLKIVLDGSSLTGYPTGLDIRSSGNVIRGLVIQRFNTGISVLDVDNNRIEGCFVGTDAQGLTGRGNRCSGLAISGVEGGRGSRNNVVGGSVPQARNLISGNGCSAIQIGPAGYATVQGNYIGTDASGTVGLEGSNGSGVRVFNASSYSLIGGTGANEANLIAFNGQYGVEISGEYSAASNTITCNRIHSNAQKGIALLYGGNGDLAAPVITTASRTQVSGTACANCTMEVYSDAADEGAIYEGTTMADASGQWSLSKPSGFSGPHLTATATDTSGNTSEFSTPLAVAEEEHRLYLPLALSRYPTVFVVNTTSDTDDGSCDSAHCSLREALNAAQQHLGPETIAFNIPAGDLGRNAEGICTIRPTTALPSLTQGGTTLDGFTQPGARSNSNPVGQPINAALKIVLDGSLIPRDEYPMGLHISGDGTVVRGLVIYGFYDGIYVPPVANSRIEGCFIGPDAHGTTAPGNRSSGIEIYTAGAGEGPWNNTIGGSSPQARNLLSGNGYAGISVTGEGRNTIQGNYIGTDATGQRALPNWGGGIVIGGSHYNLSGGTESGAANLIAYNGREGGVGIYGHLAAAYNTITRNRIHSNEQKGIALADGGNNGLAAPVITTASRTQASGTACANCTVELFSDAADEGATYEGTATANASGQWTLNKPAGFSGPHLTATATDPSGNTSEFSAPFILSQ